MIRTKIYGVSQSKCKHLVMILLLLFVSQTGIAHTQGFLSKNFQKLFAIRMLSQLNHKQMELQLELQEAKQKNNQTEIRNCYYSLGDNMFSCATWYPLAHEDESGTYEEVKSYYQSAIDYYKKAAVLGHSKAQEGIANCENAIKNLKNTSTSSSTSMSSSNTNDGSISTLKSKAEQGDMVSQYLLGLEYYKGLHVSKDYTEAVKWFQKAANQGHILSQNALGVCYQNGYGVEQDFSKAVKWYKSAAEEGNAEAQYNLGVCYYYGVGYIIGEYIIDDKYEAKIWLQKSADQGNESAKKFLEENYK